MNSPSVGAAGFTVRAPGRVNLIGEHTDYQDGFCLPIAIELETTVTYTPTNDRALTISSQHFSEPAIIDLASPQSSTVPAWANAARAVVLALQQRGHPRQAVHAVVSSTVPLASGLSSSASFCVALCMALSGPALQGDELALTAQLAEHLNGVPCGIMDQMAVVHGIQDHALLLDCRSLEITPIALPGDLGIIVIHSGLPRRLADSEYTQRRATCSEACDAIGVAMLRDATVEQVRNNPIARHVVTENQRVGDFVVALRGDDRQAMGTLLQQSHASLRDDFRVSTPELDLLVELFCKHGAYGARLTGAGFGGCVVAIAEHEQAHDITTTVAQHYREATNHQPFAFVTQACAGASIRENDDTLEQR